MERVKCDECHKTFGAKKDLVKHIKSFHEKEEHKCELCHKTFNRKDSLRRHQVTCNGRSAKHSILKKPAQSQERFECGECQKTYGLKKHLVRHIKAAHETEEYPCERCLKSFNRKENLKCHQVTCKLKCPRCEEQFIERADLVEHMKLCPLPSCDICKTTFESKTQLRNHGKKHEKKSNKRKATPIPSSSKKRKISAFTCNICTDNFERRQELFQHHIHAHANLDAWTTQYIEPDFEDEKLNDIIRTHASIITLDHVISDTSSTFNFPLLLNTGSETWTGEISSALERVAELNSYEAYKFNFSLGLILMNKETDEYRYYAPGNNSSFFTKPKRVDRPSDWGDIDVSEGELLKYVLHNRENTKWLPIMITNVVINLYYLGVSMGAGQLPDYIRNHHCIVGLETTCHGHKDVFDDGKCAFRALAYHKNKMMDLDGLDQLEQKTEDLYKRWNRGRPTLEAMPEFETTFQVSVDIYTLCEDGGVIPRYLSENKFEEKILLNLHESHLSYISNGPGYLQKYKCSSCHRHFERLSNWKAHRGACATATQFKFPGNHHKLTPTVFERLEEFGIIVPKHEQTYPYFAVFDFESLLAHTSQSQDSDRTKWIRKHEAISVSLCSNLPEWRQPQCFVNPNQKELIDQMMSYLAKISDAAHALALDRWGYVFTELKTLMESYKAKVNEGKEEEAQEETKEEKTEDKKTEDMTEEELERKNKREEEKIKSQEINKAHSETLERLQKLYASFNTYCRQLIVLSFNGSKYDLNLVKQHLIPWLKEDKKHKTTGDEPMNSEVEESANSVDVTTSEGLNEGRQEEEAIAVIKKGSAYSHISNYRFSFLDVMNYLAPGVNYSKFLKAYHVEESKSYFPYEWFDSAEKLDYSELPAYDTFWSELKKKNTLEEMEKKSDDEEEDDAEKKRLQGRKNYEELKEVWKSENMKTFKDFLIYYNNQDVGPFVSAVENMQLFYFEKSIDLFKIAQSAPGIARRWLFETAREARTSFALINRDDEDLYYTLKANLCGGPSIIFTRDAEVGRTYIKEDPTKPCENILGFDANALYLGGIGEDMPCGGYVRWKPHGECKFKATSNLQYEDMFHWMDYLQQSENIKILHRRNHSSEVRIGPYSVDGYDPETKTVYEFYGCYHHGCSECGYDKNDIGKKLRIRTEVREEFLSKQTDLVTNVRSIWSHEFARKMKKKSEDYDADLLAFVKSRQPPFYSTHKYAEISGERLLKAVQDNALFGFLEVDIHVPDHLYAKFEEMPPLFCNTDVKFEDIGEYMQNYAREHNLSRKPRKVLASGMKGEKMLLSSPYLRWLLLNGLVVTKIHQAVEYTPSPCFKEFVDQVSEARRGGDMDPDQAIIADTMKLIGNSAYGSLIMNKEKHQDVAYVQGRGAAQIKFNDPRFRKCTSIGSDLFELEMAKNKIVMDLPIQLGYHILQLAKLRMLEFKYDFMDKFCVPNSFEYIEMDTDSAYMALAGKKLEDIIKPDMMTSYKSSIEGRCDDAPFTTGDGFFPRSCCSTHKAYDKRTPGLFKVEAEGVAMIALCSKTYILKQADDKYKFSCKGVNKNALNSPFKTYKEVLDSGIPHSAVNQGFRARNNTIYTYEQGRAGISFFYCKREVLADGIHTKPLKITLSPWSEEKMDVISTDHPWSMTAKTIKCGEEFITLADVCKSASETDDPQNFIRPYLAQLKLYRPNGRILAPRCKDLIRHDKEFWCNDTYWTTGLSPGASPLRKSLPGQNILGQLLFEVKVAPLIDHDYI